jgi:regulator of protease activity HflC (stomatin/prohibitin superfamily)
LNELSVFSAGGGNESIGLEFQVDVDFTFFLIQDKIGDLHRELASNYKNVIVSRAKDAIKNEAIFVTFTEYFQARQEVEERFRVAVQKRWEDNPSLHCELDQFHLGRIQIPESVANKQLQSRVQNERNDKEEFLQQAQLERELTAVEVNSINLEQQKILRTAEAQASLIRAKAQAQAERIKTQAQISGTRLLLASSDITTQDHKSAFTYIRTLRNRKILDIDVSYLSADNVLRTQALA